MEMEVELEMEVEMGVEMEMEMEMEVEGGDGCGARGRWRRVVSELVRTCTPRTPDPTQWYPHTDVERLPGRIYLSY